MPEEKKQKPIHEDHRARMQERVRRDGLEGLAEHEVLEYLLFFAIPRKDTNALAHQLIQHFGSFCAVLEADEDELRKVEGIGPASARLISSLLACHRYYLIKRRVPRRALSKTENAIEYVRPLFFGKQNELFYLIAMDEDYIPLRDIRIAEGIPNKVRFDPVKLARAAVGTGCTCALLAHNHPTGLAVPSAADFNATCLLIRTLGPLGIEIVDHIIIAPTDASSMQQTGRMPRYDPLNDRVVY